MTPTWCAEIRLTGRHSGHFSDSSPPCLYGMIDVYAQTTMFRAVRGLDFGFTRGIQYRGALQFEERCELFWETETPIGSDVPLSAVTHEDERGITYPMSDRVHDLFESGSAK